MIKKHNCLHTYESLTRQCQKFPFHCLRIDPVIRHTKEGPMKRAHINGKANVFNRIQNFGHFTVQVFPFNPDQLCQFFDTHNLCLLVQAVSHGQKRRFLNSLKGSSLADDIVHDQSVYLRLFGFGQINILKRCTVHRLRIFIHTRRNAIFTWIPISVELRGFIEEIEQT